MHLDFPAKTDLLLRPLLVTWMVFLPNVTVYNVLVVPSIH